MKIQKLRKAESRQGAAEIKKALYISPKIVVYRGADFIRKLGPAQAGTYS